MLDGELKAKTEACKHVERQLEMATQAQKTQSKTAAKEVEERTQKRSTLRKRNSLRDEPRRYRKSKERFGHRN